MSNQNLSGSTEMGTFPIQLAVDLKSVDLAIVVQFFVNVISKHKRLGRHSFEGQTWNFCSRQQLKEYFPFWTEKMIRGRIENLIDLGILKASNHNQKKYDRTLWYAFVDESRWGIDKITICPNGQMDLPKRANGFAQTGQPIPQSNPISNPSLYKDNVETVSPKKNGFKTMGESKNLTTDPSRRWKMTPPQLDAFNFLKAQGINTQEGTLAYWAKNYSYDRLLDVYRFASVNEASNVGGYMQKILKAGSVVQNDLSRENKKTAESYKKEMNWGAITIYEKFAKVPTMSGSYEEIPFNIEPLDFFSKLSAAYERDR